MHCMKRPIEPGLLRVFRYFTGIAMVYFAIIWRFAILARDHSLTMQLQSMWNFAISLVSFAYLSLPWLEKRLNRLYLPLILIGYTGATVFSNLIYLIDLRTINLDLIIARSWLLVPILLVPLVLIAWQYSFRYVLIFVIFTNAIELVFLFQAVREITFETLPFLGMPVVRAFAFGTVGYIVEHLMNTQRMQKRKLIQANIQLGQHAHTLEHLAISRERNRLARELHDTLAHTLSGVAVNLEAIKTILAPTQTDVMTLLDHSLSATRQGLNETRRTLKDLRAQPLDDLGLDLALRNLVRTVADRAGLDVEIDLSADLPTLPPDVEQSIYRITQEALENVTRHADARRVSVLLKTLDNRTELTIADDGHGFDSKGTLDDSQFGLQGMRERAAMVGGVLSVESRPKEGTVVRFTWEKLG